MQNQETDLRKTVEMVQNMTDSEKSEIVKAIPTEYLIDEIKRRYVEMEQMVEGARFALNGG